MKTVLNFKNRFRAWLERLAKSNEELFSNKRLECCSIKISDTPRRNISAASRVDSVTNRQNNSNLRRGE